MSSSDWRNGFTLGLGAGVCVTLILIVFEEFLHYFAECVTNGECEKYASAYKREEVPDWWGWDWTGHLVTSDDTLAQWVMAIFTIVAAFVLWLTLRSANKTNIAALEANEILRREQRPWINAKVVNCRFETDDLGDPRIFLNVNYINVGKQPITDLRFDSICVYQERFFPESVYRELTARCHEAVPIGSAIFPGESHQLGFGLNLDGVNFLAEKKSAGNALNVVYTLSFSYEAGKRIGHFSEVVYFSIPDRFGQALESKTPNDRMIHTAFNADKSNSMIWVE